MIIAYRYPGINISKDVNVFYNKNLNTPKKWRGLLEDGQTAKVYELEKKSTL